MRKRILFTMIVLVLGAMVLTACGGGSTDAPVGDAANGEVLYNSATLGAKSYAGCATCHFFDETKGSEVVAPYTAGTATKAASRVSGLSAEEYIRESIVNPDAYIVDGYTAGIMYQSWGEDLTDEEINDIIAYLLTLE